MREGMVRGSTARDSPRGTTRRARRVAPRPHLATASARREIARSHHPPIDVPRWVASACRQRQTPVETMPPKGPAVSVIMPAYNAARYILDYGCGKQDLAKALGNEFEVRSFDPALLSRKRINRA